MNQQGEKSKELGKEEWQSLWLLASYHQVTIADRRKLYSSVLAALRARQQGEERAPA